MMRLLAVLALCSAVCAQNSTNLPVVLWHGMGKCIQSIHHFINDIKIQRKTMYQRNFKISLQARNYTLLSLLFRKQNLFSPLFEKTIVMRADYNLDRSTFCWY